MTGADVNLARSAAQWTQAEAARRLGITQAYLSMVERGQRPVTEDLATALERVFALPPTARPLRGDGLRVHREGFFQKALGELGYPGFAYLKGGMALNPAELLLRALDCEELESRVTEALAWLPFRFAGMDWEWLIGQAKLRDRQNRLAYVTTLARDVARQRGEAKLGDTLEAKQRMLERSRLANEDTLCKASMSQAERRWLRNHRPAAALHWNLLTDLKAEDLAHVY